MKPFFSCTRLLGIGRLACLTVLFAGCTMSTLMTATPLKEGAMEVNLQPTINSFFESESSGGWTSFGEGFPYPYLDGAFRVGLDESLDLGVSLRGFMLASLDLRWAFVNTDYLAIAICPSLGLGWFFWGQAEFTLLVDVKFNDAFSFTGSLKAYSLVPFPEPDDTLSFVGAGAGFELRLGEGFYWAPMLTFSVPIGASFDGQAGHFSFGMGFKFRELSGF